MRLSFRYMALAVVLALLVTLFLATHLKLSWVAVLLLDATIE
jgi:hypothetical protein